MVAQNNSLYCSPYLLDVFLNYFWDNVSYSMDSRIVYALHPIRSLVYLFFCLLFLGNQFIEAQQWSTPFLRGYLDDILVIPIVLPFVLGLMRFVFEREVNYFSPFLIAVTVLLFAIVFEFVLPNFSSTYTADILDVACYAAGGLIFWQYQKHLYRSSLKDNL